MVQKAVGLGVRKVNIDTDARLKLTEKVLETMWAKPDKFDPRDYLKPGREAIQRWVAQEMQYFGCAGHNNDYAPMTLDDMKAVYAKSSGAQMLTPATVNKDLPPIAPGGGQKPDTLR